MTNLGARVLPGPLFKKNTKKMEQLLNILFAISGILITITTIIFIIYCIVCLIKKDKPPIKIEKDPPVLTPEELAIIDFEKENREKQYKTRYEKKKKELEEEYFKQNKSQ